MLRQAWSSKGVKWISLGWTAFITENLVLSSFRDQIIQGFGDDEYHMIYNTLSTMAVSSIMYGFFKHRKASLVLPPRNPATFAAGLAIQTIGMIGFSQLFPKFQLPFLIDNSSPQTPSSQNSTPIDSNLSSTTIDEHPKSKKITIRCPMDFKAPDIPQDGIYGMERITRHPSLWAFGLTSFGVALRSTNVTSMAFFGFPIVFSLIGGAHQDWRFRKGSGGYLSPEKDKITSNIPFLAVLSGHQSPSQISSEIKWTNASLPLLWAGGMIVKKLVMKH